MGHKPFRSELRRDVLHLTLDTPGASVNIFTRDAATDLLEALGGVDPARVRAIVLRSGKPRSFVNGVGLMLAGTVKSASDAARLIGPVRDAYRALRNCPVPTIAAINGNCYGCGVELALQCKYRLTSDTFDTHFYMTELADYLFIPTFGATQELPRLLGLQSSVDFLIWGQRWPAERAQARGLVDRCFRSHVFASDVETFVDLVMSGGMMPQSEARSIPSQDDIEQVGKATRARIAKLPPAYHELYATCFELMAEAASKPVVDEGGYAREAAESARSAMAPPARGALPFFYLRQTAKNVALADRPAAVQQAVAFEALEPSVSDLCADIERRSTEPSSYQRLVFRMARYAPGNTLDSGISGGPIAALDVMSGEHFDSRQMIAVYAPFRSIGIDVVEVATAGDEAVPVEQSLSAVLADRYFSVIRSHPRGLFVLDELVAAYLSPQLAYLSEGGRSADLACSLRGFGFSRLPGDWIPRVQRDALRRLLEAHGARLQSGQSAEWLAALPDSGSDDGIDDPVVIRAVLASLGGFAARLMIDGVLRHPSAIDIAARDVIDFPLCHTSLCRYVTSRRVKEWLAGDTRFRQLVPEANLSSLEHFVAESREFYRGHGRS